MEGKAKRILSTDQNELRVEYKDEVTAGNGAKKAQWQVRGN
ncbi:phosphoribosylaminoimidazolesuccinocarboxamide synthase [Staphylococcus aureus]